MRLTSGQRWTQARYAFVGLLVGNAALLVLLLVNAMRIRSSPLSIHIGQPEQQIGLALQIFAIYGFASLVGWLFVGFPIAMFIPAESILRLPFLLKMLIGLMSGPIALFLVFLLLSRGRMQFPGTFVNTGWLWFLSIVMSTVAFGVYVVLLRKVESEGPTVRSMRERSAD